MKKYILYSFVCLMFNGCSLNIKLEDQFSDPDAITDILSARGLLASAYSTLPQYNFELAVLSDDYYPTLHLAKEASVQQLYQWRETSLTELAGFLWNDYYCTVAACNSLLERTVKIHPISTEQQSQLNQIESEAKILKAMCYFDLLRIFAPHYKGNSDKDGIILKDYLELGFLSRSSIERCVTEIRKLLTEALSVTNKQTKIYLLSAESAAYLSAELYLYTGNYTSLITVTEDLIGKFGNETMTDYKNLWSDNECSERIFAKYDLGMFYTGIVYDYTKGDYLVLNNEITFDPNDVRKQWCEQDINMDNRQVRLFGKYNKLNHQTLKTKYINRQRAAGIYLMRAEAFARDNKPAQAVVVLNRLLVARGGALVDESLSGNELIARIMQERRVEFVGEGERYFDLKRCADTKLKRYKEYGIGTSAQINTDDYRWTLPIPASEYRYNKNVTQNNGWPKIGVE